MINKSKLNHNWRKCKHHVHSAVLTCHMNLFFIIIIWGWRSRWSARSSGCWSGWAAIVLVIFLPLYNKRAQTFQNNNWIRAIIRIRFLSGFFSFSSSVWKRESRTVSAGRHPPCLVVLLGPPGCWGGGGGGGGDEPWSCPCERSAVPYIATVRLVYQPRSTRPSVFTCKQQVHNYLIKITRLTYKFSILMPKVHLSAGPEHNGFVFIIFQTESRETGKIKIQCTKTEDDTFILHCRRYFITWHMETVLSIHTFQ